MESKNTRRINTGNISYSEISDNSIWGLEETVTSDLIDNSKISGRWLNLCAGDGRFNNRLLRRVDELIAVDLDENALGKLIRIVPEELRRKLATKTVDVTKTLPFQDEEFDGILCVGSLHLFPKQVFKKIQKEMERTVKSKGLIIIDFATNIKRTFPDGSLGIVDGEPSYTLQEAEELLRASFKNFQLKMITDTSVPEKIEFNGQTYVFTCDFIVLSAIKE